MKILVSTFNYLDFAGTETFTYNLLKTLVDNHFEITFYSPFISDFYRQKTTSLGIKVYSNIGDLKSQKFDVIHVQHNINAVILRYHFPKVPIVFFPTWKVCLYRISPSQSSMQLLWLCKSRNRARFTKKISKQKSFSFS